MPYDPESAMIWQPSVSFVFDQLGPIGTYQGALVRIQVRFLVFQVTPCGWGQRSDRLIIRMATLFDKNADVAELADAHDSGSCARNGAEVQVLSSAPRIQNGVV